MEQFVLNDKPAVKIFGFKIKEYEKSVLCDCEGDEIFFPKKCVQFVDENTMLVEE